VAARRGRPGPVAGLSAAWATVVVVALATAAIKASGPLVAAGREPRPAVARVLTLAAPALLAALVATQTVASDGELVLDERAAGLAGAGAAIALRAPILVVVLVAAAVTAALRALG
jgi:Branched-chain amino acid transport protein (AzlD)